MPTRTVLERHDERVHAARALDLSRLQAAALPLFLAVAGSTTLIAALNAATRTPFWSDELLAVWAARLPRFPDVTSAIWHGAEFSPPTFDWLLHLLFGIFGSSALVARAPSIVALACTAIALACIVGRRLGSLPAALAFGLVLNSSLFAFAVQARPYAILTALVATITLLWSDHERGAWRPAAIGVLLFACVSLHVYAVVAFPVFALMEGLLTLRSGRLRPAMWLAFAGAAAVGAVWLPLVLHLAAFNRGDTGSPGFYGAPTLPHLVEHLDTLLRGSPVFGFFLSTTLFVVAGAAAVASRRGAAAATPPALRSGEAEIAIIAGGLLASLPVGFALALGVTHVFSARYALPATLGAILLLVLGLTRVPYARAVGVTLCVLLAVLPLLRAVPESDGEQALALLGHDPAGPVVVSDSNLFMEMMESAPPALRRRIVHLAKPPGVTDADTSADHQLERLVSSFRPDLPVRDPLAFMAANPRFTEICRPQRATDAFCRWLVAQGRVAGVGGLGGDVAVLTIDGGAHAEHP